MTKHRSHADLWAELESMEVQDCLRWHIEPGDSQRIMSANVSAFSKRSNPHIVLRTLRYGGYLFIVRVA